MQALQTLVTNYNNVTTLQSINEKLTTAITMTKLQDSPTNNSFTQPHTTSLKTRQHKGHHSVVQE